MSAPPYMKLYIADYLAETTFLDVVGHGAYLLLIMAMWRAGGRLPRDEAKLARIAQCTPEQWAAVRDDVLSFFKVRGGCLTHNRVANEIAKYDAVVDGAKRAGKASASKKARKNNAQDTNERSENVPTFFNQPEPERERETPVVPNGDASPPSIVLRKADVEAVWDLTPKSARERTSRADIERALQSAARRGHAPSAVIAGLAGYYASPDATKDGGQFAKGAHRMIQNDRWQAFADVSADVAPVDPNAVWRKRVKGFVSGARYWNTNDWGHEPGRPGCIVPPEIIAEFQPQEQAA
jgi:uncharacterized protein YdaU (DUF1376 family)